MSQFLKKNAKLIYLLMFAFSLFIFVSSTVYITEYNDTALYYKENVLKDPNATTYGDNINLVDFISDLDALEEAGVAGAEFNLEYGNFKKDYDKVFRAMFNFNQDLQLVNNTIFYLGLFAMAMVAIMCICANASRKKYYISNLVSGIVCPAAVIAFSAVAIVFNVMAMLNLAENWEIINWGVLGNQNLNEFTYTVGEEAFTINDAVMWFIQGDTSHFELTYNTLIIYSVFLVLFVVCNGLLIAYNVYRYKETKKELSLEGLGE